MRPLAQALRAATVFDPTKLQGMSIAAAELLVDDFTYFKFPEFTAGFIADLKAELRLLLQHARKPFNWADVPGAADYDARRKAQLAKKSAASSSSSSSSGFFEVEPPLMDNYSSETPERSTQEPDSWQEDPAEKARRIWEWWVIRAGGDAPAFVHWPKALRLVALVQPSSADVERLFSQLKLVIQQIGVMALEQTIETRVMVRVNKLGNKK